MVAIVFSEETTEHGSGVPDWSYELRFEPAPHEFSDDIVAESEITGLVPENVPLPTPRIRHLMDQTTSYRNHLVIPRQEKPSLTGDFAFTIVEPEHAYTTKSLGIAECKYGFPSSPTLLPGGFQICCTQKSTW
ncbi:hypothetical protein H6F89_11405 [Cyanobacteria bacterium FACHB-63]|nr:hypothetical protein [Cyanobacteria bacterium FACHB-63]